MGVTLSYVIYEVYSNGLYILYVVMQRNRDMI